MVDNRPAIVEQTFNDIKIEEFKEFENTPPAKMFATEFGNAEFVSFRIRDGINRSSWSEIIQAEFGIRAQTGPKPRRVALNQGSIDSAAISSSGTYS
jgi:hypothetical protein